VRSREALLFGRGPVPWDIARYARPRATIEAIAPSFFVTGLARSVDWYVRVLGFGVDWNALDHAGVRLGPALIVLVRAAGGVRYQSACHIRLASGLDDYVAQIVAAGLSVTAAPRDRPEYGMREAHIRDPDGNDIYLGQEI
jgi:catechol 2,3-dioxygenase-like lactoylglutathione lyase family enzyme